MAALPRKPWWKRKRWIAAILLWVVLAYPLSLWPVAYGVGRGWLPASQMRTYCAPVLSTANALMPQPVLKLVAVENGRKAYRFGPDPDPPPRLIVVVADAYLATTGWFEMLGQRHAQAGTP